MKHRTYSSKKEMFAVDLRIAIRNDENAHAPWNYVRTESLLHNLQYAIMWDSLRPPKEKAGESPPKDSIAHEWVSFSKARRIAKQHSFLMCEGESQKLIELFDESCPSLTCS